MLNRAKELNDLLLSNKEIKEYLDLKNKIANDKKLSSLKGRLDKMRKTICKNKELDSTEYYELLSEYKSDERVKRYEALNKEIRMLFAEISDILMLK